MKSYPKFIEAVSSGGVARDCARPGVHSRVVQPKGAVRRAQKPKVLRTKLTANGQVVVGMPLSGVDAVNLRAVRPSLESTPDRFNPRA